MAMIDIRTTGQISKKFFGQGKRGITVSQKAIRLWCVKFGALYSQRLKRKHRGYGDTF